MSLQAIRAVLLAMISASMCLCMSNAAEAGWLTRLMQDAGELGGTAARRGADVLDDAGRYVTKLPKLKDQITLAARRDTSGHWVFTNTKGETFTAASPAEMGRVTNILAPAITVSNARLVLVLADEVALSAGRSLDELPSAGLRVLVDGKSYPLTKSTTDGGELALSAQVRPHLSVPLAEGDAFHEAVFQLERRFEASRIRVVALDQTASSTLTPDPLLDAATKLPIPDRIAPDALANAMPSVARQMVVLTGRIDGDQLYYRTASGAERFVDLIALKRAAAASDVDLIVLTSLTPRQPGTRNWLWQRAEVSGLDTALKRSTLADFLSVLGENQGELVIRTARAPSGRVQLQALPLDQSSPTSVGGTIGTIVAEVASETAGSVLTSGIEADLVDSSRARELDSRIIPGVPSDIQFAYLGLLLLGFLGLPVARNWWFRIWPPEERGEYSNAIGYNLARLTRLSVFLSLFLPLSGAPAAVVNLAQQIWGWIMMPFRVLAWLLRVARSKTA